MTASNNIQQLFSPKSIAIIGATDNITRIGGRPIHYMLKFGYRGKIIPVNPKYEVIQGLKCYPSLDAYPDEIDLAIVAINANAVLDMLERCAAKGIKVAIVYSSGFSEAGVFDAQNKMREIALRTGMRILGPNCLGAINARAGFAGVFSTGLARLDNYDHVKDTAFITQSGAFGIIIDSLSHAEGQGFGYFINTGNEVDIELADCIEYAVDNDLVKALAVYCEGVRDGKRFVRALKKAKDKKIPIVIAKVGVSERGGRAASSHTGSVVGTDNVYDALFKKYGVIRAKTTAEVLDFITLAEIGRFPTGRRVAVMTNSGGAGIYLADKCAEYGLELPQLPPETREKLDGMLPSYASSLNPVDTTANLVNDPTLLEKALTLLVEAENIDSVVVFIGLMDGYEEKFVSTIKKVRETTDKYILLSWMSPPPNAVKMAREAGIPILTDPARSIRALGMLTEFSERVLTAKDAEPEEPAFESGRLLERLEAFRSAGKLKLSEYDSKSLLQLANVPVPGAGLAETSEQAVELAREIGFPVAMKIESPDILHKTDAGCVKLNIASEEDAAKAFAEIMSNARAYKKDASISGINVQKMIPKGVELIVGAKADPVFGMSLMVGAGGVLVELMKEVALRVLPVTRDEIRDMLGELRISKMLKGFRGAPPVDMDALVELISAVGQLAYAASEQIQEIEINPLIATEGGVYAADALITLNEA